MRIKDTTAFATIAFFLLYWNASAKMVVLSNYPQPFTLYDVLLAPIREPSAFLLPLLVELVISVSQLSYARKKELAGIDRWVYAGLVVFSAWLSFVGVGPLYASYFGAGEVSVWAAFLLCVIIDFLAEQMLKQVIV